MKVLIFRHGIAEDSAPDLPDPARQLTRQGYNRTRLAAIGLTRLMRPVDVILTSPYIRAEQTATILGQAMRRTPQTLHELAGDRSPQDAIDAIFQREDTSVAIVGHNPQLEQIVTLLCTPHRPPRKKHAPLSHFHPDKHEDPDTTSASPRLPGPDPDDEPIKLRKLTPISKAGAVLLRAKNYPDKPATLSWAMSPRTLRMLAVRLPRQRPPFPMSDTGIRPDKGDAPDDPPPPSRT